MISTTTFTDWMRRRAGGHRVPWATTNGIPPEHATCWRIKPRTAPGFPQRARRRPTTKAGSAILDTCYAILFLRRATLSLTGMVPPRPAPMVEKPKPSTLAVRYQGRGLPPVLLPAMELVLDCSSSMKDLVEGEPKYLVARRIMLQAVDELPEDFQVGLRVFGHMGFWGNNPGQPADDDPRWNTDSEMKISIGSLVDAKNRRKLIKDWINYVKPAGATPLVYSLLQAKADLSGGWPGPKMVNVVTDGMETCGGKLEDVAAAYKNGEMEAVVNIVGFGVPAAEEKQLKEIARHAGGKYFDVHTARQLAGISGRRSRPPIWFRMRRATWKWRVVRSTATSCPSSRGGTWFALWEPNCPRLPSRFKLGKNWS